MILNEPTKELNDKYERLKQTLASYGSLLVAYSAGVDSTFLLFAAHEALGEKVTAITASSVFVPGREIAEAEEFCKGLGIRHVVLPVDELKNPEVAANPKNRCYLCKKDLFTAFLDYAREYQLSGVAEGSNLDDEGDYRPGMVAIAELGIKSPLRAAGFTKEEIRILSRYLNLPTWSKPSFACLASRIPYGELLTAEKLGMVEEAEEKLLEEGFTQFRVRIHENERIRIARIELMPEDFPRFMEETTRNHIYEKMKELGFTYVTLDLQGYRTGSLNEILTQSERKG